MNKLKYIIVPVLAGLTFTACNNEPPMPSQAELDTQVEAKVKAATDQLKADCDARLMEAAKLQADSVLAKVKPSSKPATATPPAPVKTPKATTPPTTKTPKATTPKTEKEKVKDLFDKKAQENKVKDEGKKVKDVFKNEGKKTEAEIKKEEEKVKGLFNK